MMSDLTALKLEEKLEKLTQTLIGNRSQKKGESQPEKRKDNDVTPRMKHVRINPERNLTMTSEEVATIRITEESLNIVDESTTGH